MSCDVSSMEGVPSAEYAYRLSGKLIENALGESEAAILELATEQDKPAIDGCPQRKKQLQGDKLTILRRTNEMRKHLADSSTSDGGRRNSIRHNGR
ncbi:unnamed protein product [Toxocara canis]|uniref:Uncharacterized protein n=1 Tax=Toxocara canis TaxID=6265 RepID=A0A183V6P5_TOXCA|nr:unnamed protein product [Toxocara canis]